jgi:APA family basic amino acid/polyamine antiporter
VGVEIALNPGAEIKSPARAVPLAILAALGIVTVFYLLIHLVAVSALGDSLAAEQTAPLAAAASRVLSPAGPASCSGGDRSRCWGTSAVTC